jgi:glutathione synthase/RimK-type ligase-like ATP-grasp enzyme
LKVALVTHRRLPGLTPGDRLFQAELQGRRVLASVAVWDEASLHWADFDRVVIRSCWDYHYRLQEFLDWVGRLEEAGVPLWNPPSLVRVNAHKSYLRIFESAGLPVVPTAWVEAGSSFDLRRLLEERGWSEAVVKPAVSASSRGARRVSLPNVGSEVATWDLLVQPFLPEVSARGEWSFVFFAGVFSHAVLKVPAAGDFRVQTELGGRALVERPSVDLVAQAEAVARLVPQPWLYARVDGIEVEGRLMLMEVELIEPDLFLESDPEAPARFAAALLET